jgi:DNA-binding NarL/FixJ family response regulator
MPESGPQAAPPRRRLLVVDDDPLITRSLERVLLALEPQFEIAVAQSGIEALYSLAQARFDAVITDLHMPGLSGTEWLTRLRREHPETLCVVHSSQIESFGEDEVRRLVHAAFGKPTSPQKLIDGLRCLWLLRGSAPQPALRSA